MMIRRTRDLQFCRKIQYRRVPCYNLYYLDLESEFSQEALHNSRIQVWFEGLERELQETQNDVQTFHHKILNFQVLVSETRGVVKKESRIGFQAVSVIIFRLSRQRRCCKTWKPDLHPYRKYP